MLTLASLTSCVTIVASLCVDVQATAEVRRSGSWSGAIINLPGATATSMLTSDAEVLPYIEEMQDLCSDGTCTWYQGHCGGSASDYTCTLWYSYDQATPLRKIDISGDSVSVSAALDNLMLIRSPEIVIPLTRFHYDARDALPPTCYSRSGCPPR